ncbi:MAG: hypothetical protein IKK27_10050 [Alistipes sp.]|nr:hypothetical protein [Alistipes sp.]
MNLKSIFKIENKVEFIFLLVVGLLFYLLNYFSILAGDDWPYCFICENVDYLWDLDSNTIPIEKVSDIFISQYNHWQYTNGRVLVHFIVQLFVGILGIRLFQVCNTLMIVLLIKYICKLCISSDDKYTMTPYLIVFVVFYGLMGFIDVGQGYMANVSISVNYLWPSALFVVWLYFFYHYKDSYRFCVSKKVLLFLFAFIFGAMQESFSVGLSVATFVYFIFNKREFRGYVLFLTLGLWLGTCVLCISPSNIARFFSENSNGVLREFLLRFFWLGTNYRLIIPLLILVIGLIIRSCKNRMFWASFYSQNKLMVLTIIFIFLFLFAVGLKGSYQMFTSISLLSIILIVRLLPKNINNTYIGLFVLVIFCIHYVCVLNLRMQQKAQYDNIIDQYIKSKNGQVEYDPITSSRIVEAYGLDYRNRLQFNYNGMKLIYGHIDKNVSFIPSMSQYNTLPIVATYDRYCIKDAGWCYISEYKEDFDIVAKRFTHNNWLLKLWVKFSSVATTEIVLESYDVEYQGDKYKVTLKKPEEYTILEIQVRPKE